MFFTDGTPSDDKVNIMQTIKDRNAELHNKVVIMTYGMLVYTKILLDIANQDGTSYGVDKTQSVTVSKFKHHISHLNNVSNCPKTYVDCYVIFSSILIFFFIFIFLLLLFISCPHFRSCSTFFFPQ